MHINYINSNDLFFFVAGNNYDTIHDNENTPWIVLKNVVAIDGLQAILSIFTLNN